MGSATLGGSAIRIDCRGRATSLDKSTGTGKNAVSTGRHAGHVVCYLKEARKDRRGKKGNNCNRGSRGRGEGGEEPQPYVPNWPQVRKNSNLASVEEKLEWLQNCVPLNLSECYDTLEAGSVIELGVQSSLLVRRHVDRRR